MPLLSLVYLSTWYFFTALLWLILTQGHHENLQKVTQKVLISHPDNFDPYAIRLNGAQRGSDVPQTSAERPQTGSEGQLKLVDIRSRPIFCDLFELHLCSGVLSLFGVPLNLFLAPLCQFGTSLSQNEQNCWPKSIKRYPRYIFFWTMKYDKMKISSPSLKANYTLREESISRPSSSNIQ